MYNSYRLKRNYPIFLDWYISCFYPNNFWSEKKKTNIVLRFNIRNIYIFSPSGSTLDTSHNSLLLSPPGNCSCILHCKIPVDFLFFNHVSVCANKTDKLEGRFQGDVFSYYRMNILCNLWYLYISNNSRNCAA